ncbi:MULTISPECIES: M48 family metalloprotease [unclassified Psychrobacter]|uniref:M48 family metalloprotease n=1 Tax=unclassified Psychrobacter TaxID=196806 RepID=UPI002600041C|nr:MULTISPECIES: M48 family metalloprotease [unclassified Psychrobacter]
MDFFGAQRSRTQRSLLLYGLFFLIVFAHIAVALGITALLLTIFTGGIYHWVLILVLIWTIGSFVIGSFLEYGRLKAGGRAIAQRVGAVRLFIDHSQDAWEHSQGVAHQHEPIPKVRFSARQIAVRDEPNFPPVYRRYYEIAQQLAIASGLRMPVLYVLPEEQGINGFVAGRHSQDMVLVVTQGALDKLSDEALYGLIGHEYGHILHGDATFNLQLMIVLAGLQLLYDWSDSINNFGAGYKSNQQNYFDGSFNGAVNQSSPLPQRSIDRHARSIEAQTAVFNTHSEWVSYWQRQSQSQESLAKSQSKWLQHNNMFDSQAPRNIWTLLIHGLSFSSMASAQLIKHSFNRERELLADATSVQLTRSPAIMETLKAIHKDSLGSRLTGIADINGLSHFFFASSGADLGDLSWFATHPSLAERMNAINANAYHDFALQVAKEKRINQQKIREIYEQHRLGDWDVITANSLSKNKSSYSTIKEITNSSHESIDKEVTAFATDKIKSESETEDGLEFIIEQDIVIDGRLQVQSQDIGTYNILKPWQAKRDSDLPAKDLISSDDIKKVSLSPYILNHSYHPLGAQALIEAVLLCHQGCELSTTATYDLTDIWLGLDSDRVFATETKVDINNTRILPHTLDHKLLETVAILDRRLDSALIVLALKQLRQHNLSESAIDELRLQYEASHSHQDRQHYVQQKKCRTMLLRYQQGITEIFETYLTADLSKNFADNVMDEEGDFDEFKPKSTCLNSIQPRTPSILALWQALHFQQLLPVINTVLNDDYSNQYLSWQQKLQVSRNDIIAQLDPSGQIFKNIKAAECSIVILLAYRLSNDGSASSSCYTIDLRRQARLIDIDLTAVSEANLQWLLLTAQHLNSIQLLALLEAVSIFTSSTAEHQHNNSQEKPQEWQQGSGQIDYNEVNKLASYHDYRQWLSTLHTAMLHDTIVSQDEYDCLTLLSEHWLQVRQLF